jgi:hypothetical protein
LTSLQVANTKLNTIGLTSFDLAFSNISIQAVIEINAYLNSYDSSKLKTSDSYIPGIAGMPENQALRIMILYKWLAMPLQEVIGMDSFQSNLFSFEKVGLTYEMIKKDIEQRVLFPYSYERILVEASTLAASSSFPDSTNSAAYYSYGLKDGTSALNSAAAAFAFGKAKFAGLVAREKYLRNFLNNLGDRFATPDEIKETDFWNL